MAYIQEPQNRENLVMFGDGSEAIFKNFWLSHKKGYYLVHLRPTDKMRWKYQIQNSEFDKYDNWIKKTYKIDLCHQLDFNVDFPTWIILCDYHGNEETPMMKLFDELILKNRRLDKVNRLRDLEINMIRREQRRKIDRPDEAFSDFADKMNRIKKAGGMEYSQQPPQSPDQM